MYYKSLPLAILTVLFVQTAHADDISDTEDAPTDLGVLHVTVKREAAGVTAFANSKKASDLTVSKSKLQHKSATLGNALAGEIGVHSNPFGGGASAPVVRGQEGVRVKVLQNGLGVADMSTISPDHAVAVDTLLASRVEIVRGASTLMHANASPAGVVNVADNRILTTMPSTIEGEGVLRHTTGSDEKMALVGVSMPIGDKVAVRVEAMDRDAKPYNVPAINFGEVLTYLPDSQNQSSVGSVGVSYIGDKGHVGVSLSERRDKYGLVGHNHKFDSCSGHVLDSTNTREGRAYLNAYPHLMTDEDMIGSLHFHCGTNYDQDHPHSHDNVYGHDHDHTQGAPWVDMKVRSIGLSGELINPIASIDKIRIQATKSDYQHSEFDEGKTIKDPSCRNCTKFVQGNTVEYANNALLGKVSVYQSPSDKLKLVWGLDTQKNHTFALIPSIKEKSTNRRPLVKNTQKTLALFGLSQYDFGKLRLETGLRHESTRIPVEYNMDEIKAQIRSQAVVAKQVEPDLSAYRNQATSFAISTLWDLTPKTRFDATFSHNERLPTPMELYYHGKHLATNSFLYGNRHLDKEKSNNLELGLSYKDDKWHAKGSVYTNHFDNYIHPENLYKHGNLAMRRFTESKANIRGAEFELGYHITPNYRLMAFGDVVFGRLHGFAPVVGNDIYGKPVVVGYESPHECGFDEDDPEYKEWCAITKRPLLGKDTIKRPDRHAPRMSPVRFGARFNGDFGNFSASLEYMQVYAQDRLSHSVATKYDSECPHHAFGGDRLCPIDIYEDRTNGYRLLNVGLDYYKTIGNFDTTWSIRGNNLFNEKIYIHNSFLPFVPQQGRNFGLSVNVKF